MMPTDRELMIAAAALVAGLLAGLGIAEPRPAPLPPTVQALEQRLAAESERCNFLASEVERLESLLAECSDSPYTSR